MLEQVNSLYMEISLNFLGITSLKWIASLNTEKWVAITASSHMKNNVEEKLAKKIRPGGKFYLLFI